MSDDPDGYFLRNLVYLLRRIPPGSQASDSELGLLVELSQLYQPPIVIREAVGALANWKHPRSEQTLIERLEQIEAALTGKEKVEIDADMLRALLDRTIVALSRLGTANALRSVVAHAFKRQPAFGNSLARLHELASHDLSSDSELVEHLVRTLIETSSNGILRFARDRDSAETRFRCIFANRAAETYLGNGTGTLVGMPLDKLAQLQPERLISHFADESANRSTLSFEISMPSRRAQWARTM